MQLVGYQIKCFDELYGNLVDKNCQFILLRGPKGCGKSIIVNELSDLLKESWKVFKISGAGKESPPYYTWYSASHRTLMSKDRVGSVSLGVNFQPFGLPIGLDIGVGFSQPESLFNANEQAIIMAIQHEIREKENILIFADDFNSWDFSSKELLFKLFSAQTQTLGKGKRIFLVLIDAVLDKITPFVVHRDGVLAVDIDDIAFEDIEQIIVQQDHVNIQQINNLEHIIQFTGYDLRLITLAVHYHQENQGITEIKSLRDLIEKRILSMSEDQKIVCRALEYVSIINSLFSEKEAAFLLDKPSIQTERILSEAVKLNFIRKEEEYDFHNLEIKAYFEDRLDVEKKYLHHRFAKYLQSFYPEDYINRAYHLFLSGDVNREPNQLEAAYLVAIEILRRREVSGDTAEHLLTERLNEIIDSLPPFIGQIVKANISEFNEGYYLLRQCNYDKAIIQFAGLHHMYASKAFSIESMRLLLLCYVQLADDINEIKRLADELYANICHPEFLEDEIWCQVALQLLEVYGDRHVHVGKFQELKNGFDERFRKHIYQNAFRALHAKYSAKSSLFFASIIAVKLTEDSCEYYRTYNSILNLYFSLCNNAGNRIVCGDYVNAQLRLDECKRLEIENSCIRFPGHYKVDNNIIINTFLQNEGILFDFSSRNRQQITAAARTAARQLNVLRDQQSNEVSHVIEFNLFSMLMLSGDQGDHSEASAIINHFEIEYRQLDNFYKYYYHNACCANSIIFGEFNKALFHLKYLEDLNVVLLSGFSKILKKRNQHLRQLIMDRYEGDAFSFNYEFIRRGIRVQDPSATFWGRGLLLSDLQFLSL